MTELKPSHVGWVTRDPRVVTVKLSNPRGVNPPSYYAINLLKCWHVTLPSRQLA